MDSDSDSKNSLFAVTEPKTILKTVTKKKKKLATTPPLEEEAAYQKRVKWLQDHGEPLKDTATEPSEEESVDSESSDQS